MKDMTNSPEIEIDSQYYGITSTESVSVDAIHAVTDYLTPMFDTLTNKIEKVESDCDEKVNALQTRLEYVQELAKAVEKKRRQEYTMKLNLLREKNRMIHKMYRQSLIVNILFMIITIIAAISITRYCNQMSERYEELADQFAILTENYQDLQEDIEELPLAATTMKFSSQPVETIPINTTNIAEASHLSAEQLDAIIDKQLTAIGQDTTQFSGLGEALVAMEESSNVNALFCLAVGSLESGHGTSVAARNKNNLFGLIGNNGIMRFENVKECVEYWGSLMRKNYIDQGRETISAIQSKYCPGSTTWASNVQYFMDVYVGHVET